MRNTQLVTTCGKLALSNLLTSRWSSATATRVNSLGQHFPTLTVGPLFKKEKKKKKKAQVSNNFPVASTSFIPHLQTSAARAARVLEKTSFAIQHPLLPKAGSVLYIEHDEGIVCTYRYLYAGVEIAILPIWMCTS